MLLPKPDPYDKARRIILFLGAASLVTGLFKLFSPRGDMVDKENKKDQEDFDVPHADIKCTTDLDIDVKTLMSNIEEIILQLDPNSGVCKGRV